MNTNQGDHMNDMTTARVALELVPLEQRSAAEIFRDKATLADVLAKIKAATNPDEVPDTSTAEGRARIKSLAYKVSRSKVALDDAGKDLVAGIKAQAATIDELRRTAREELDTLRDFVRAPLDAWEAEQDRIEQEAIEQARREREAEEARKAAEEQARREELERREAELRAREEALARAEREAREREEAAAKAERDRLAEEQARRLADEARAAKTRHRNRITREAIASLVIACPGLDERAAAEVVGAVAHGNVDHLEVRW